MVRFGVDLQIESAGNTVSVFRKCICEVIFPTMRFSGSGIAPLGICQGQMLINYGRILVAEPVDDLLAAVKTLVNIKENLKTIANLAALTTLWERRRVGIVPKRLQHRIERLPVNVNFVNLDCEGNSHAIAGEQIKGFFLVISKQVLKVDEGSFPDCANPVMLEQDRVAEELRLVAGHEGSSSPLHFADL